MKKTCLLLFTILLFHFCQGGTWQVGPTHTYTMPSQVSSLVLDGDTVVIDAGIYLADVARWTANNLVITGMGGLAHLKANGNSYGGKAIWVIAGNNTTIENIEFSLCSVPDQNGAGIRQEGHHLIVRHCYFHDNENGILAGTLNPSNILIEYSEFGYNGYGDGQSHNLYINNIDTLIFRYNYSHHAIVGHELKSRARVNFILYNRISDEASGTASRSIDLPNGGSTFLIGNLIEQGPLSQNSNLIGYGLEGLSNPAPNEVYAINNTLINNANTGSFFAFQIGTLLFKGYNNIAAGNGVFISGNLPAILDTASNRLAVNFSYFSFANALNFDFQLTSASVSMMNTGTDPGFANGYALMPLQEYAHIAGSVARCVNGLADIGAFEYCPNIGITETTVNTVSLYPNPTNGVVSFSMNNLDSFHVEVHTGIGQSLLRLENPAYLDLSGFPPGLYFVKIMQKEGLEIVKILKN